MNVTLAENIFALLLTIVLPHVDKVASSFPAVLLNKQLEFFIITGVYTHYSDPALEKSTMVSYSKINPHVILMREILKVSTTQNLEFTN